MSPSRNGAACMEPRSGALAVTNAAKALIKTRASARSASRGEPSPFVAKPQATADAVNKCMATVSTSSTAGTSAISRPAADSTDISSGDVCSDGTSFEEAEARSGTADTLSSPRFGALPRIAQAEPVSHLTTSGRSGPTIGGCMPTDGSPGLRLRCSGGFVVSARW